MLDDKTKWLFSVIEDVALGAAKKALLSGANPNFIDEEIGQTPLQEAILKDSVELTSLLLEGVQDEENNKSSQMADVNKVGHSFQANIDLASKKVVNNNFQLMQKLIEHRTLVDGKLLDKYLFICLNRISNQYLTKSDFSLLAHYVSRLCNDHVGEILKRDNNDDRYIVHLCQYSFAEKEGEELEGWHAEEFLPLRIFSLFEIWIKIKKEIITVPEGKKEEWCQQIHREILTELETLRLAQERIAINEAETLSSQEQRKLYDTMAIAFFKKIKNNPSQEFSIAGGYRGHAIYMSFSYDKEKKAYYIRYDNLGSGIDNRHQEDKEGIYPRLVAIKEESELFDEKKLLTFISMLFFIKGMDFDTKCFYMDYKGKPSLETLKNFNDKTPLLIKNSENDELFLYWLDCKNEPCFEKLDLKIDEISQLAKQHPFEENNPKPFLNEREIEEGFEKQEKKMLFKEWGRLFKAIKKQQRQERLCKIYDDENTLGYSIVDLKKNNMKEQSGSTCTVTSHQVGLFSRLNDESFYKWIVAEEKRCIVQVDRNEGALECQKKEYWDESILSYSQPEFASCCPELLLSYLAKDKSLCELICEKTKVNSQFLISFVSECCDEINEKTFSIENYIDFIQEQDNDTGIILYFLLKIAEIECMLKKEDSFEKYVALHSSLETLKYALTIFNKEDLKGLKLYLHYVAGLCAFYIRDFQGAISHYEKAFKLSNELLKEIKESRENYGFYTNKEHMDKRFLFIDGLNKNIKLAQGFAYIEIKKLDEAESCFESTGRKQVYENITSFGLNFIPSNPSKTLYPVEAFYGLGTVYYQKACDEETAPPYQKKYIKEAFNYFLECKEEKTSPFAYKAEKKLNLILHPRQPLNESQQKKLKNE